MGDLAGGFATGLSAGAQGIAKYPELYLRKQELENQNAYQKGMLGVNERSNEIAATRERNLADYYKAQTGFGGRQLALMEAAAPGQQGLTEAEILAKKAGIGQTQAQTAAIAQSTEQGGQLFPYQKTAAELGNRKGAADIRGAEAEATMKEGELGSHSDMLAARLESLRLANKGAELENAARPSPEEAKAHREIAMKSAQMALDSARIQNTAKQFEHTMNVAHSYFQIAGIHPEAASEGAQMASKIAMESYAHQIANGVKDVDAMKNSLGLIAKTSEFLKVVQDSTTGDASGLMKALEAGDPYGIVESARSRTKAAMQAPKRPTVNGLEEWFAPEPLGKGGTKTLYPEGKGPR